MKLRSVNTEIWTDDWFSEKLSPVQKLVWFNLITNQKSNLLGIFEVSTRRIAFETGLDIEQVKESLRLFVNAKKIIFIGNYVILRNHLKNNTYNTNMKKSVIACFNDLPYNVKRCPDILHKDDVEKAISLIKRHIEKNFSIARNHSETISNHSETIRKDEDEYEVEEEGEASPFDLILKIFLEWYNNLNPQFPYKENDREDDSLKEITNYLLTRSQGDIDGSLQLWRIILNNHNKWPKLFQKQLTIIEINKNLNNILNTLTNVEGNSTDQSNTAKNIEALRRITNADDQN